MHTSKMTTGDPEFPNLCNFMTWNKAALRTALEAAWHDIDKLGTINADLLAACKAWIDWYNIYGGHGPPDAEAAALEAYRQTLAAAKTKRT